MRIPIRWSDSIIMQAPALTGVILGGWEWTRDSAVGLLLFVAANFLFAAHSFCFNDWSGALLDEQDANKSSESLLKSGVNRRHILITACALGLGSGGLFACLGLQHLILLVVMIVLSVLYSFPHQRFEGKRRVGWSSFLHVAGGMLYVLNGYLLFHTWDARGLYIGLYFGLAITAGHLAQEVQDHAGDDANRISTAAVRFGPRAAFLASTLVFSLAHVLMVWLAHAGWVAAPARGLLVFWLLQLGAAWYCLRRGLGFEQVRRYRRCYQILFGLVALTLCGGALR